MNGFRSRYVYMNEPR